MSPSGVHDRVLMVKSRRAASAIQSSVNNTLARLPYVSTSTRSVVTSKWASSMTAVTVPWSMPLGTARMPALSKSSMTFCGESGVAMSMSRTGRLSTESRTHPPTNLTSVPSAVSAAITARVAGAVIHGKGEILPVGSRAKSNVGSTAAIHAPSYSAPGLMTPPGMTRPSS